MNSLPKLFRSPWGIFILGSGFVIFVWLVYAQLTLGKPLQKWGEFCDKFGALNTLFTGLALVGLIATLVHQHNEAIGATKTAAEVTDALIKTVQQLHAQRRVALYQSYLDALVARIDGYTAQQHIYRRGDGTLDPWTYKEQEDLLHELEHALALARKNADAEGNKVTRHRKG